MANTGDVDLTDLSLTDVQDGTGTLGAFTCAPILLSQTLVVGDTTTCTATYTLSQADIDAGAVTNLATACGNTDVCATDTETVNPDLVRQRFRCGWTKQLLPLPGKYWGRQNRLQETAVQWGQLLRDLVERSSAPPRGPKLRRRDRAAGPGIRAARVGHRGLAG